MLVLAEAVIEVSTGNLMMPFALPGHPPKAQHGIGFSPRLVKQLGITRVKNRNIYTRRMLAYKPAARPSVAPPICSTSRRASCIATPIQPIPIPSQTPRATATAQRPAQWQSAAGAYSYHQARLMAAPVAQGATSGTTLLARAASVPTVPTISRIIRPGALQTLGCASACCDDAVGIGWICSVDTCVSEPGGYMPSAIFLSGTFAKDPTMVNGASGQELRVATWVHLAGAWVA